MNESPETQQKPEAGQPLAPTAGYALEETRIATAGVIRCCLQDVAMEYKGERVALGYKSQCPHCKTRFTLVWHTTPRGKSYPLWKPDWQLNGHNTKDHRPSEPKANEGSVR